MEREEHAVEAAANQVFLNKKFEYNNKLDGKFDNKIDDKSDNKFDDKFNNESNDICDNNFNDKYNDETYTSSKMLEQNNIAVIYPGVTYRKQNYKHVSRENWHEFCLSIIKKMLFTTQAKICPSIKHCNKAPSLVHLAILWDPCLL